MSDMPPHMPPPLDNMDRERIAVLLDLTPIPRLTKDILEAAKLLSPEEAGFLVDAYYRMQKNRIRTSHQTRTLEKKDKPHSAIAWLTDQDEKLEHRVRTALNAYSGANSVGIWMRGITGVGPVIAAGFLAGLDIKKAPTVGHFWRICGLNPEDKKVKGKKLVWDPQLKRLCWILGDCFTKVSGYDSDIYGKVSLARKQQEIRNNDLGRFAEQAQFSLETKDFSKDTLARAWYAGCFPAGFCARYNSLDAEERLIVMKKERLAAGEGVQMLPPARIQLRSQRYAVKLFLSHLHYIWHETHYGVPPALPYILNEATHAAHPDTAVHTHFVGPPNWPM